MLKLFDRSDWFTPRHVCVHSHIDHVTYVVRAGESQRILSWYGAACGMQRFLCTAAESRDDGTVIGDDVGLR
jgi:hypothetical protein